MGENTGSRGRAVIAYLAEALNESDAHQVVVAEVSRHRHQQPEQRVDQHTDAEKVLGSVTLGQYSERYLRDDVAVEERAEQIALHRAVPREFPVAAAVGVCLRWQTKRKRKIK